MAPDPKSISVPVPAATILLVRDGDDGMEVFMVERHAEIDFGGGALVFPGGKVAQEDYDAALAAHVDGGADWPEEFRALAVAAIREAFEEAGVLLARDAAGGELVAADRLAALDPFRMALERKQISMLEFLRRENLRIAGDQLVPFAHWITPRIMPQRFDTYFFLARVPENHAGQHCGRESVNSLWVRPADAVFGGGGSLMFPTRMNLMKLRHAANVDDALAEARSVVPVTVEPWVEDTPNGKFVRIREDAGYDITRIPAGEMMPVVTR
jgi:8-oxo-dGTP pyrophosphatase MutT (NUDIX family)